MTELLLPVLRHPEISLPVLAALALMAMLIVYRTLRKARLRAGRGSTQLNPSIISATRIIDLRASSPAAAERGGFERAARNLSLAQRAAGGNRYRARILALSSTPSGRASLLGRTGLRLPQGYPESAGSPSDPQLNWWLFDAGAVLEITGDNLARRIGRTLDFLQWRKVLAQIRSKRPARPVEGLLILVSASVLLDPDSSDERRIAGAARAGESLRLMLVEAQRVLGMKFPAYLMLTDCAGLPGFEALEQSVVPHERRQIFGWSNPYPVASPYSPGSIDHAFEQLAEDVQQRLLCTPLTAGQEDHVRALLSLTDALEQLREPVRTYANQIFGAKVAQEAPYFRGVYLCGGDTPEHSPASESHTTAQVSFAADLLEEKVFPEAGLAHPDQVFLSRRNRHRLAAALGALLLLAGAAAQWTIVQPSLAERAGIMARYLASTAAVMQRDSGASAVPHEESAQQLLLDASRLQVGSLSSLTLPASWFSDLSERTVDATSRGLRTVVLNAVRDELMQRIEDLEGESALPSTSATSAGMLRIDRYPSFKELASYVERVREVEKQIALFDRFSDPGRRSGEGLKRFNELTHSTLGSKLSPANRASARFFKRALAAVELSPFDESSPGHRARINDHFDSLKNRLLDEVFVMNPLAIDLGKVTPEIAQLAPAQATLTAYQDLRRDLDSLRDELKEKDIQWVFAPRLELGEPFDKLLTQVRESRYLGERAANAMASDANERFQLLRGDPARYTTSYTDQIVEIEDKSAKLSAKTEAVREALTFVLEQPFMVDAPPAELQLSWPSRNVMRWRVDLLERALIIYRAYQAFPGEVRKYVQAKGIMDLPQPVGSTYRGLARELMQAQLMELIARAQRFETLPATRHSDVVEASLIAQMANLTAARRPLRELLSALVALDSWSGATELEQIVRKQVTDYLRSVEMLLADNRLYLPEGGGFAWWDGSPAPARSAFTTPTASTLPAYLKSARARIQHLALDRAQPMLDAASEIGVSLNSPLATRWTRIASDINAYNNKIAGNDLAALEAFLTGLLREVDLFTCFDRADAPDVQFNAGDYFLARRAELWRALQARCRTLADDRGFQMYQRLAQYFNEKLAGKFPFAAADAAGSITPDMIRDFYQLDFHKARVLIEHLPDPSKRFLVHRGQAQSFIRQMVMTRDFFTTYLAPDAKHKVPVYDLAVRFRVRREAEIEADQIIDWELEVGDKTVDVASTLSASFPTGSSALKPNATWVFGMPISLKAGWASGSTYAPQSAEPVERVVVEGPTLRFDYRGPWSLLRLLAEHRTTLVQYSGLEDVNGQAAQFDVTTLHRFLPGKRAQARFFIRLGLLTPGASEALAVPTFPSEAPVIGYPALAARD